MADKRALTLKLRVLRRVFGSVITLLLSPPGGLKLMLDRLGGRVQQTDSNALVGLDCKGLCPVPLNLAVLDSQKVGGWSTKFCSSMVQQSPNLVSAKTLSFEPIDIQNANKPKFVVFTDNNKL